jgi:hypothetical protein
MNGEGNWQQWTKADAADARLAGVQPACELTLVRFCWDVVDPLPNTGLFVGREYSMSLIEACSYNATHE